MHHQCVDLANPGDNAGLNIKVWTKEFYTDKWRYAFIDAPGHRHIIKNMITGASHADVALVMVPADGNFTSAIAKGSREAGEFQGQTRQHTRLIDLLGGKHIGIGVNYSCGHNDTLGFHIAAA